MSYILDALKKSEEERHQGEVPNLGMNTTLIHNKRNEQTVWPWVIGGLLVINLFIVVYWLIFSPVRESDTNHIAVGQLEETVQSRVVFDGTDSMIQREPKKVTAIEFEPSEQHTIPKATPKPVVKVANGPSNMPPSYTASQPPNSRPQLTERNTEEVIASQTWTDTIDNKNATQSVSDNEGADALTDSAALEEPLIIRPKSGARRYVPPTTSLADSSAASQSSAMPSVNNVAVASKAPNIVEFEEPRPYIPHISDMELVFQRQVPDMTFNSHIYTKSRESRRVMINNIYLREGQAFSGMVVEEIMEDGVALSINGEPFRIGVLRNWRAKR